MSLSATLIIYPGDEIKVVALDKGSVSAFDEIVIGPLFNLWVGGLLDADAVIVYSRLANACRKAAARAQVRLNAASHETAEVAS